MDKKNLELAIQVIEEANRKVCDLVKDYDSLQIRANHVFTTLANGFKSIHGSYPQLPSSQVDQGVSSFVPTPIIMANAPTVQKVVDSIPQEADIEDYRERVIKAYESFVDRDAAALLDSLHDSEIRGVAKMAGIEVSPTEPEHLSHEFINEIKDAITAKKAIEEAEATAKAAAEELEPAEPAPVEPAPVEPAPKSTKKK